MEEDQSVKNLTFWNYLPADTLQENLYLYCEECDLKWKAGEAECPTCKKRQVSFYRCIKCCNYFQDPFCFHCISNVPRGVIYYRFWSHEVILSPISGSRQPQNELNKVEDGLVDADLVTHEKPLTFFAERPADMGRAIKESKVSWKQAENLSQIAENLLESIEEKTNGPFLCVHCGWMNPLRPAFTRKGTKRIFCCECGKERPAKWKCPIEWCQFVNEVVPFALPLRLHHCLQCEQSTPIVTIFFEPMDPALLAACNRNKQIQQEKKQLFQRKRKERREETEWEEWAQRDSLQLQEKEIQRERHTFLLRKLPNEKSLHLALEKIENGSQWDLSSKEILTCLRSLQQNLLLDQEAVFFVLQKRLKPVSVPIYFYLKRLAAWLSENPGITEFLLFVQDYLLRNRYFDLELIYLIIEYAFNWSTGKRKFIQPFLKSLFEC
jgi:hypothetical protein